MPEPSQAERRKAAQRDPAFAVVRWIGALERDWEIGFRRQSCGTSKTWRRDTLLAQGRRDLKCTMAEIHIRLPCPRGPGRMPIMTMSGLIAPGDGEAWRWAMMTLLLDAGLSPADCGYGWTPTGRYMG